MAERRSHAGIETDAILHGAESTLDRLSLTLAHSLPDLEEISRDTFCAWRSRQRPEPMVIAALEFPLSAWC